MRIVPAGAWASAALLAVGLLGGCNAVGAGVARPSPAPTDAPPEWFDPDEMPETSLSFADGPDLAAAARVWFHDGLGEVWDWETVGEPTETTTELVNTDNDCHLLDERTPYDGAETDDRSASATLVETLLAGTTPVAGPDRAIGGLGEGLGEGGPTYDVMQGVGRDADGGYTFVTARVFAAAGVQQSITVTCPTGTGIDRARSQLAQTAYVGVSGLDRY